MSVGDCFKFILGIHTRNEGTKSRISSDVCQEFDIIVAASSKAHSA